MNRNFAIKLAAYPVLKGEADLFSIPHTLRPPKQQKYYFIPTCNSILHGRQKYLINKISDSNIVSVASSI